MKITPTHNYLLPAPAALVVGIHQDKTQESLDLGNGISKKLQERILSQLKEFASSFTGKSGEILYFTGSPDDQYQRKVVVVGLGKEDDWSLDRCRQYVSSGIREASGHLKERTINLTLGTHFHHISDFDLVQAATEAAMLATYEYSRKSKSEPKYDIEELRIIHNISKREIKRRIELGETFARAQILARDLVNAPARDLTPSGLADAAKEVAKENGLEYEILGLNQIKTHGMGGLLAVSAGSNEKPKFIVIRYRPQEAIKHIALVGKGVTFDAGGLSIKPSESMLTMKCDKGGAAAVIGIMSAITKINPKVNVTAIIPATENMLGGSAYKLGDVVTFMDGQTAEIHNTDAEGRVILGDALSWAVQKEHVDKIFDFATLTGACVVALGEDIIGIMTNNDALAGKVIESSQETGEKMWRLPLDDNLRKQIDGDVADFNNTGKTRYGGASTAAAFLEKFVGDTPWVHHDIAGPAFRNKADALGPSGATGVPVRTILHFLKTWY